MVISILFICILFLIINLFLSSLDSLDEDSDFGIEFVIDTAIPVDVKLFWNLKKEDFNSLICDKKEQHEKEYLKSKRKNVYEPLSSMDGSTELPIELDRTLSSFVHFSHTSSSIRYIYI